MRGNFYDRAVDAEGEVQHGEGPLYLAIMAQAEQLKRIADALDSMERNGVGVEILSSMGGARWSATSRGVVE